MIFKYLKNKTLLLTFPPKRGLLKNDLFNTAYLRALEWAWLPRQAGRNIISNLH
jgi:hypothetical protein